MDKEDSFVSWPTFSGKKKKSRVPQAQQEATESMYQVLHLKYIQKFKLKKKKYICAQQEATESM